MTDAKSSRFQDKINAARRQSGASTRRPSTDEAKKTRRSSDAAAKKEQRRSSTHEDFKNMDPSDIVAMLELYASVDGETCSTVMGCLKDGSSPPSPDNKQGKRRGSKRPSQIQKPAPKLIGDVTLA